MFRIYDGREQFFQWDLDRKLIVEDASITEVHFCNRTAECALPVATYKEGNLTLVNVPNLILQESFRMNVYAYDGKHTKHAARFEIVPRSKPDTYVYTETEIKSWDDLFERIEQIEENGISDAAVEAAIEKYLDENDIRVDLTGYATEKYVQEQIANIDIPEVEQVDEVYVGANAPTDENIKIWVDTDEESPVATKTYVQQKVAEAQLGGDVDLSAYYTKTEVDAKIETIELTPGPAGKDGKDGQDGAPGKDGAPGADGKDYVLTEADKQEIAGMVEVTGGGDADLSDYYTKAEVDEKIAAIEIPEGDTEKLVLVNRENWTTGVSVKATDEEKEAWAQVEDGDTIHYKITDVATGTVYSGKATVSVGGYISVTFEEEALTEFVLSSGLIGFEATFATANVYIYKSTSATVDLSNYYTKAEVDELIAASGTAEEVIWQSTLDPRGDGNELSDDEVAKLIEVSSQEVSITLKNHDDNSEITFKSNVYYDKYGSTLEFQGVDEATDGLLGYLYVYTDSNTVDTMLDNTSGKADIKIFLPGQRDYYTREEADSKMQSAISTALSAIGVAEEGAY